MLTNTHPSIPGPNGPKPGPDPLAEIRAARALLMRLTDRYCPDLEHLVLHIGPLAAAERLRNGDIPGILREQVTPDGVRAAAAAVEVDAETSARCGARLLIPEDEQWPTALAATMGIPGAQGMWVRGRAGLEMLSQPSVVVSGSRAASGYGIHVATDLAGGLSGAGRVIMSGAGFGIDAAAHRGALAAQGTTVAVLPCGIDRAHPAAHVNLLDRIAENGLVVSAQPLGTTMTRARMLDRNRLLAALGDATVVVEAAARSGVLHLAGAANASGRPVMAVPGPVTSALSVGTHRLIRDGATMVTGSGDVIAGLRKPW
ncbi:MULTISPECIES: DNA-processing protein DprA [unclassified Pseudonocardia]|uniref:DNA-processing protein DprA n=1 Tax=unclassified Pseudonocardia TaxID=2619320 RepID=UPI0001FFE9BA|nr:DNA-processing protein DprA [Pseudonocardia sp. Ae707_Ps1]OLM09049.1 Rossmann fold nucleotide-binding protein Smf involved in DNA uptake [Pseudonocardia sp. Ae707_Ps1]